MEPIARLLSLRVKEYVDSKHAGNINKVANILKADYNNVYRLYHGTLSNAPFFLAYEILKKTDPDHFRTIMFDYFPVEMAKVAEIATPDTDPLEDLNKKMMVAFGSDVAFILYIRSQEQENLLTISNVKEEFGTLGLSIIDKMASVGIVVIEGDRILSPLKGKNLTPSETHIKEHAKKHLQFINLALPGTLVVNRFGGLNDHGSRQIFKILESAVEEIDAVYANSAFSGPNIVLSTIASGLFLATNNGSEQ
ncbi:MAG TPA: hypothetical protein VE954_39160 [Oligoflexus sp.]|nr:hypothetical protein [Oligoflexus sp.]